LTPQTEFVRLVSRARMEDPSERRGTTRVEKRKTVAVGDGGTTIEVRTWDATARPDRMDDAWE
jgi:hypothetical protein